MIDAVERQLKLKSLRVPHLALVVKNVKAAPSLSAVVKT